MIKFTMSCILLINLTLSGLSYAETGVSKDWAWNTDQDNFYFAITTNSKEQILGEYCYIADGICFYIVGLDMACEPGSSYPVLVNSDKGADHVILNCAHEYNGRNILAIYEFDKFDDLVRKASRLSIAIPILDDKFRVIRFSLVGSSEAIDHMRRAAKKAVDTNTVPKKKALPAEEVI
jgi:hypothetical protein